MKLMNVYLLKILQSKWRNVVRADCGTCCIKVIPRDVPKGHLVVYVGENYKRHVIKISLLKHPLFKALLDVAQDVYDFGINSKLCIPCDECVFLEVLRCASGYSGEKGCF